MTALIHQIKCFSGALCDNLRNGFVGDFHTSLLPFFSFVLIELTESYLPFFVS